MKKTLKQFQSVLPDLEFGKMVCDIVVAHLQSNKKALLSDKIAKLYREYCVPGVVISDLKAACKSYKVGTQLIIDGHDDVFTIVQDEATLEYGLKSMNDGTTGYTDKELASVVQVYLEC